MNIKDLNYYVLFVFKDETNDRTFSTTDVEFLKKYTSSDSFKVGDKIIIFEDEEIEEIMIIKNIEISKVSEKTSSNYNYGWSKEGIILQGEKKEALLQITITVEEPLD